MFRGPLSVGKARKQLTALWQKRWRRQTFQPRRRIAAGRAGVAAWQRCRDQPKKKKKGTGGPAIVISFVISFPRSPLEKTNITH